MSLPPGTRITNGIAHDICVRDAAAATIDGSIASLGKNYVVTLQAIGCRDGATIARAQVQADDKEQVLNAVGTAATAIRARLGESRDSIRRLNRPLEQATTGSLQALQHLTTGRAELAQGRFLSAAPWFERAIALDPNFATAYRSLSLVYNNAGNSEREAEYSSRAFALIDRVSERERYSIAAGYYQSAQELNKAIDTYRLGIGNYPREWTLHNNLSENLNNMGQFEEGLKEGQVAVELLPSVEPGYRRVMDACMCLGRIDEAKKVAEQVRSLGIDGARIHQRFLEIAYIEDDSTAAAKEMQWFAGKPEEYFSFALQAAYLNVHGQRRESSKLYRRAADTALRRGFTDVAAGFEEADARADALVGNCGTARRLGRPALALAMCGDAAQAERLAERRPGVFQTELSGLPCNCPRFAPRPSSSEVSPRRRWNCWQPRRLTSARIPRRVPPRPRVSAVEEGRRGRRGVQKDPRSQGHQLGQHLAPSELGSALFDFLPRPGACTRARGRRGAGASSIRGFVRRLEGRRHRYPHPSTSQGGVREAAMTIGDCRYLSVPLSKGERVEKSPRRAALC